MDADGVDYGKEFHCILRGSKERYVYRAVPVLDNKRDVAFSYDRVTTQNGVLLADKRREWEAQGKTVEEKVYIEALVELYDPDGPNHGEYAILSISPTSKGRFTGHVAKAAAAGGGTPGNVITKVSCLKITKVQNAYYAWQFDIAK